MKEKPPRAAPLSSPPLEGKGREGRNEAGGGQEANPDPKKAAGNRAAPAPQPPKPHLSAIHLQQQPNAAVIKEVRGWAVLQTEEKQLHAGFLQFGEAEGSCSQKAPAEPLAGIAASPIRAAAAATRSRRQLAHRWQPRAVRAAGCCHSYF